MEASGAVLRPSVSCGYRRQSEIFSLEASRKLLCGCSSGCCGFSDQGHSQNHYAPPRCGGGGNQREQGKRSGALTSKKKMKLVKGLRRDLSAFSDMGFGLDPGNGLVDEVKAKMISEAAEVLRIQLEQVRAAEKESKRRRKLQAKVANLNPKHHNTPVVDNFEDSSGSSCSESSDEERGEEVVLSRLRSEAAPAQPPAVVLRDPEAAGGSIQQRKNGFVDAQASLIDFLEKDCSGCCEIGGSKKKEEKRIEVCMGGKCRKSGAAALMAEFERAVGEEGAVVGCKCMGKCRVGPNVRVSSSSSTTAAINPLCIGVGLEDVGVIVSNLFGDERSPAVLACPPI
ncbi:diacylglycerol O-acyltransferase 3 [Malania oleifera]|uniref:diacylglycerol O-acyltransferase 3 n=1 Tax=Malania oleifera TaxID=397392 RepID=UPI0025ADF316|nr:diacylglycerol O-acyltransferase 3 [Malania oleifera]